MNKGIIQGVARLAWRTPGRITLGILFSGVLGWMALRGLEWRALFQQFRDFPVFFAFLALAVVLLMSLLRAYRWQVLFIGERPSVWRLFLVQNTGIGLNSLTPVRVLSEVFQFAMLTVGHRVKPGVAAATLGMERVLDMVTSAAFLLVGLTLIPARDQFLPYVLAAAAMAVVSLLLVRGLAWSSGRSFVGRIKPLMAVARAVAQLERSRGKLAYSLAVTIIVWLGIGVSSWVLAHGMGLDISPLVATLAILGTLYLATALPGLPAAVGTFEFAIVYFLGFFGVAREVALGYAITIHVILFLPPVAIAIAVMLTTGLKPRESLPLSKQGPG